MSTKLIKLSDGTFVEVSVPVEAAVPISGVTAQDVDSAIDKIKPFLLKICKPLSETWKELNQEMHIQQAEVELGLSFEVEGDLFIAKTTAGANIVVKLILNPKA